tara:strand:+ start:743 stop:982 length:240 start_codon:yes stop_codon:yes gene_type:complete
MRKVSELLELINQAIIENGSEYNQWFIDFSGHVNKIGIRYYQSGWKMANEEDYKPNECDIHLDDKNSIQEGYWFIKNRL